MKVCSLISDNSQFFIQWPQKEDYAQLAAQNSFPDALGRVIFLEFLTWGDHPLLKIEKSFFKDLSMALSSHSLNQKTLEKAILIERSFILSSCKQYACTGDQRIIDVSVGYPSSMNDKRVFK